jgi:signal transduction protein with GAF and PtsI domain
VLDKLVGFATSLVESDSCFVYVREGDDLVMRASKNPRQEFLNRLKLKVGEGITGWVAEHRQTVAIGLNAWKDPRFKVFSDLPEDRFESFLSVPILTRGRAVGVISLQNQQAARIYGARNHLDFDHRCIRRRGTRDGPAGSGKRAGYERTPQRRGPLL